MLVEKFYDHLAKIGGNSVIVDVYESKFGKRKYHRGHHVKNVWVLGIVESTALRRILLFPVEDRTKQTLSRFLRANVDKESIVFTNCWGLLGRTAAKKPINIITATKKILPLLF